MNKFRTAFQIFTFAGLFLAVSMIAHAQATRTWVSGLGNDANTCSRTAPCATFGGALSRTVVGGEINCLDPGGYGSVTIHKSVTIDCEDTQGAILSNANAAITINLNDPTDAAKNVRIRGLIIHSASGQYGIRALSPGKLTIEETTIDGFSAHGISIENASSTFNLVVKNTTVRNNAVAGINIIPNNAAATVFVTNSLFAANGVGYFQASGTTGMLQSSTFTGSATGIQVSQPTSVLAIKGCRVTHNVTGVQTVTSATIRLGANIITANGTGLSGSNIFTWGGNNVDGNTSNGTNNGGALSQ